MNRDPPSPGRLAERQWRDYQARDPGTCFAEAPEGLDLEQAYRLQEAVARLRTGAGDEVAGYKVGCTGPGTVEQFGMEGPIRGCLFRSELRRSGDTIHAARHANLAIEGEMAFRIGADGEPAAAFPVIELHNFVFRGAKRTLVELVGNNGLNAGVVLPATAPPTRHPASGATMAVQINGDLLGEGGLWRHPDRPRGTLDWLRGHLAASGLALAPGHLVLAGTALGLYPVRPGSHVRVSIDGVPAVECRVA